MAIGYRGSVKSDKYKVITNHPNKRVDEACMASLEDIREHLTSFDAKYRKTLLIEVYEDNEIAYNKVVGTNKLRSLR